MDYQVEHVILRDVLNDDTARDPLRGMDADFEMAKDVRLSWMHQCALPQRDGASAGFDLLLYRVAEVVTNPGSMPRKRPANPP